MSIAISMRFMEAFSKLPDSIQKRTIEFLERFEANPKSPGFNYETINASADKKIRSVRVNDTYRVILKREEETGTYILLWVDHHDEAYDWAMSKRCELNTMTGRIQVFSVEEATTDNEKAYEDTAEVLFAKCSNEDLLKIGVPERQLNLVKSIKDYRRFNNCKYLLPEDTVENLEWIANDIPVSEVVQMVESTRISTSVDTLEKALNNVSSSNVFVIVDGQEELRNIMNGSLEKWRVFLHPAQRDVVEKDYSGPARVLGEAGTGKTVVAMHRAKRLAGMLGPGQKVLFTTFTANLADDIESNLKKICSSEELYRIETTSIDAWVSRFLSARKFPSKLIYGKGLDEYWNRAISSAKICEFERDFYKEEWSVVVSLNEAYTLEKYLQSPRTGRGTRLDRAKRCQVWDVFDQFIKLTSDAGVIDIDSAMYQCRKLLAETPIYNQYPSIIVDEGQDFSANSFSLIRAIGYEEHKNDIFIVGDAHQRIYRRKAVLSRCGINIKGRSSHLKVNYRTTEEIRKYAYSILTGLSFDDLDGNVDDGRESRSFTHGPAPIVKNFPDRNSEVVFVCEEISHLINNGVLAQNICIVARTSKLLEYYAYGLSQKGLRCFEIKRNMLDDRTFEGVRVATMHRVKGLEFQYVFIVSANKGVVPLDVAIDHTDKVSENETIKSEKCLIYVALTRTQKCAYVTSYGKQSEFLPAGV